MTPAASDGPNSLRMLDVQAIEAKRREQSSIRPNFNRARRKLIVFSAKSG